MKEDCVFCKIASKEIKADIIFENDDFFVIRDISPKVKGHSLVIPKKHFVTFLDIPTKLYENLLKTTKKAVNLLSKETGNKDFNLLTNNGPVAGQIVNHFHLHVLPRQKNDGFRCGVD